MFDLSESSILQQLVVTLSMMDKSIQELMNTFTRDIATGPNWVLVTKAVEVSKMIALMLVTGYWIVNLINEVTEIDWRNLSMWWYMRKLAGLILAEQLINMADSICLTIYQVVGWALKEYGGLNTSFELFANTEMKGIMEAVKDMGLMEKLIFKMDLMIPQMVILVCAIVLMVLAEFRIMTIYLMIIISPVCLATAVNKGVSGAYPFIKEFVGVTAQAVIMVIAITLYNSTVMGNVNLEVTGLESLYKLVVHTIVLLVMILSSQGIAKMLAGR